MVSRSIKFAVLAALFVFSLAGAAEYYVSPGGDDGNPGTESEPFASVARGQEAAAPGDTVWIGGGEYVFEGIRDEIGVLFDKSGEEGNPIRYWAVPGETPVFDFFNLTTEARIRGFSVTGSWLHFKGLELKGVQQIITDVNESWCIRVENGASHNIFEQLDLHHNEGPGLFIADGADNLVLNCDSHHNYDPDRGGENADGFGSHSDDDGNVFRGCRAWENSDDGYDLINSPGIARIENCWAWRNGFVPDTNQSAGNGAGIKAGGFGLNPDRFPDEIPRHVVTGSLAFENRVQGFYANHHPGGLTWLNNTSFDNPRGFDMLADQGPADHFLRNNLSFRDGDALARETPREIDDAFNSWNEGFEVTADDFRSTYPRGVASPRATNGSLPNIDFMKLAPGSDLIDAGEDVGLPFNGEAPDLGASAAGEPEEGVFNRFEEWREAMFDDPESDESGPDGDPDNRGVINLLRYAFGIELEENPQGKLPRLVGTMEDLRLAFAFSDERTDIAYFVEASSNLEDWDESLFDSRVDSVATSEGILEVDLPDESGPRQFYRVRVVMD